MEIRVLKIEKRNYTDIIIPEIFKYLTPSNTLSLSTLITKFLEQFEAVELDEYKYDRHFSSYKTIMFRFNKVLSDNEIADIKSKLLVIVLSI